MGRPASEEAVTGAVLIMGDEMLSGWTRDVNRATPPSICAAPGRT